MFLAEALYEIIILLLSMKSASYFFLVRTKSRTQYWRGFDSQVRQGILFPGVSFQCRLSYGVRTAPAVCSRMRICINICTHVKDPGPSAKSAGGRLELNTHTPYVCGFAWSDMLHGCMVYTERAEMAAVSCGSSHASAVSTPLRWIFKNAL